MFNKNSLQSLINKVLGKNKPQTKMDILAAFLARNKKLFIRLALALVAGLLFLFLFDLYQKSAQEKYSAIFHQSLIEEERGNIAIAKQNLQKIYETKFAPSGVKGLSALRYAGLLLNEGSYDEALAVYQSIATSSRYDRYLRELAGLLAVKIIIIKTDIKDDKSLQQQALKQIEKLESRSKFLHPYLAEQKGIFLMKIGELEKSYQIFEGILKDQNSEQALKLRVADMVKLLVAEGYSVKL